MFYNLVEKQVQHQVYVFKGRIFQEAEYHAKDLFVPTVYHQPEPDLQKVKKVLCLLIFFLQFNTVRDLLYAQQQGSLT